MQVLDLQSGVFLYSAKHMASHKDAILFLPEVCEKVGPAKEFSIHTIDMGRVVGICPVVQTTDEDDIFFARRPKRHGNSRFVRNRTGYPCNLVTIIMNRERWYGKWATRIITAYIGPLGHREPEDTTLSDEERKDAIAFWNAHAFIESELA